MPEDPSSLAKRLCDRRIGIGGDGLILVCPPTQPNAAVRMRIINSDGSEAEMCGNAIRCFSKYVYERGICKDTRFVVETISGPREVALFVSQAGIVEEVEVCMGKPTFLSEGLCCLRVLDQEISYWPLIMNVPHAVVMVEDPRTFDVDRYGAAIERAEPFPAGTNVDFIALEKDNSVVMRVWERGCGHTLACGTGATAAAACCMRAGLTGDETLVRLELGVLKIRRDGAEVGSLYMRGPAALVFDGEIL